MNGGNATYFKQMKYDVATDKFIEATAVDWNGDAAGTVHVLGNQEESTFPRKDDGSYDFDITIFENDSIRLNALDSLAPISTASSDSEEGSCEDGVKFGGTSGQFDTTKPVCAFWTRIADHPTTAKKRFRHYFGQFNPAGGLKGQKAKQRNRISFKISSVDSKDSTAVTIPTIGTFPEFTGVPATALASPYKHGKYVDAV